MYFIFQPGHEVFVHLPDVDVIVMEKLVQYLYLGQTTTSKAVRDQIENLCKMLRLEISLDTDVSANNTDSDDSQPKESSAPAISPKVTPSIMKKSLPPPPPATASQTACGCVAA